jgi:hypothetical protein
MEMKTCRDRQTDRETDRTHANRETQKIEYEKKKEEKTKQNSTATA